VLRVLEALKIDLLIHIGGEDTLGYAARISTEGFPIISIPRTLDNDVFRTDFYIGLSTAITRSVQFIQQLCSIAGSHERTGVVELFGRHSGETSVITALLAGAERAIISEIQFGVETLSDLLVTDKAANPRHHAMMTISEGAKILGEDAVVSGEPDPFGDTKLGGFEDVTALSI
jgi:6-phosphofructokinase 1